MRSFGGGRARASAVGRKDEQGSEQHVHADHAGKSPGIVHRVRAMTRMSHSEEQYGRDRCNDLDRKPRSREPTGEKPQRRCNQQQGCAAYQPRDGTVEPFLTPQRTMRTGHADGVEAKEEAQEHENQQGGDSRVPISEGGGPITKSHRGIPTHLELDERASVIVSDGNFLI